MHVTMGRSLKQGRPEAVELLEENGYGWIS